MRKAAASFRHLHQIAVLCLLLTGGLAVQVLDSTPAAAASAAELQARKPLAIIRFNQQRVYFEQALAGAVTRAMQIKPDVTFTVLNIVPESDSRTRQAGIDKTATRNLARVVTAMRDQGVSTSAIKLFKEHSAEYGSDEVWIFVD
jgi:ABC-type sugar transport system substrate-binding protein